jgi:hypothetical protein
MHLKPTAGCQPGNTFTLAKGGRKLCRPWYIFHGIFIETPLHNLFSNIKVDIWHPAVGLRCIIPPRHFLGGIMHLKPTAGCQISIFIFEKKLWRGFSINIPWKIYQGRQSSCPPLPKLKVLPGSLTDLRQELCRPWYIFHEIFIETPLHNLFSNIKIDIWYPAMGLRCIIPPQYIKDGKVLAHHWLS